MIDSNDFREVLPRNNHFRTKKNVSLPCNQYIQNGFGCGSGWFTAQHSWWRKTSRVRCVHEKDLFIGNIAVVVLKILSWVVEKRMLDDDGTVSTEIQSPLMDLGRKKQISRWRKWWRKVSTQQKVKGLA